MGKFKVGDKIRLIDDGGKRARRGATATVKDDTGYWTQIIWDRNELSGEQMDGGYCRADFELIPFENIPTAVRTVTRREIETGRYGKLELFDDYNAEMTDWSDAQACRDAARIFNEIADVLDEQKEAA